VDLSKPADRAEAVVAAPVREELVIKARKGWVPVDFRELIRHRELLYFMVWRDIKVKYKQAILGFAWAIMVPLIQVILFSLIGAAAGFNTRVHGEIPLANGTVVEGMIREVKEPVPGATPVLKGYDITLDKTRETQFIPVEQTAGPAKVPAYPLYVYSGLLPWLFLAAAISTGGMSLVYQQNLLTKIYMPRMLIPMAAVGVGLVDMALSAVVFTGMFMWYGYVPSSQIVYLPLLLILAVVLANGLAISLSALTVNFRDMRFLLPFVAQILMWVSAAVYPPRIFKPEHMSWLDFNPIYGVITGFRSALLGEPWNFRALAIATGFAVVAMVWGMFYFKKAERRFADIA
jgi:lipopolysaccharide transport system permease protein